MGNTELVQRAFYLQVVAHLVLMVWRFFYLRNYRINNIYHTSYMCAHLPHFLHVCSFTTFLTRVLRVFVSLLIPVSFWMFQQCVRHKNGNLAWLKVYCIGLTQQVAVMTQGLLHRAYTTSSSWDILDEEVGFFKEFVDKKWLSC